jgi:hypothetical protein
VDTWESTARHIDYASRDLFMGSERPRAAVAEAGCRAAPLVIVIVILILIRLCFRSMRRAIQRIMREARYIALAHGLYVACPVRP